MAICNTVTIELYEQCDCAEKPFWQVSGWLTLSNFSAPAPFRTWLVREVRQIRSDLISSQHGLNAAELAATLMARSARDKRGVSRFEVGSGIAPGSTHVFRIFIEPDGTLEITCFAVEKDARGLLKTLDPIDEPTRLSDS